MQGIEYFKNKRKKINISQGWNQQQQLLLLKKRSKCFHTFNLGKCLLSRYSNSKVCKNSASLVIKCSWNNPSTTVCTSWSLLEGILIEAKSFLLLSSTSDGGVLAPADGDVTTRGIEFLLLLYIINCCKHSKGDRAYNISMYIYVTINEWFI